MIDSCGFPSVMCLGCTCLFLREMLEATQDSLQLKQHPPAPPSQHQRPSARCPGTQSPATTIIQQPQQHWQLWCEIKIPFELFPDVFFFFSTKWHFNILCCDLSLNSSKYRRSGIKSRSWRVVLEVLGSASFNSDNKNTFYSEVKNILADMLPGWYFLFFF